METIKNKLMAVVLGGLALGMTLSSCQKKFDPNTYKPSVPLPSFAGYTASKDIETNALVAYWGFNGDLKEQVSGITGTATGTSFGTGLTGQALQGAANSYVTSAVPPNIKNLHSFTASFWVKMPQNTTGAVGLVSIANSQSFWGSFDVFFDNGATATTGVLKVHCFNVSSNGTGTDGWLGGYTVSNPWNNWVNIIVAYDDVKGAFNVYYQGASVGTANPGGFSPLNWTGAQNMAFGALQFETTPSLTTVVNNIPTSPQYYGGWASYLTGNLTQVSFYNVVLSKDEIGALYNLQKLGR
ncbi:MAG: LamG-like jellyroll fold domain-containing protein [Sphingobacteriales bacterium]